MLYLKILESFVFFVNDIIIGVGLGTFDLGYWVPTPKANFLIQVLSRNKAII